MDQPTVSTSQASTATVTPAPVVLDVQNATINIQISNPLEDSTHG